MIKNCQNCVHKNVCGLKEKYNQYVNEMKTMKEKYPEMGFTTDCPSWRFENEVGINKCDTCKYKKQAQDDIWNSLVRDGERVKAEDIKDKGTIKEPYTVTYINREDTKEEIDKKLKEILGLDKGESKGNITLNNDGTVTFNNSSEIKTIPSNENNRGKRAERIGYLNLNNNNFQDNKELLDIIMSLLLS